MLPFPSAAAVIGLARLGGDFASAQVVHAGPLELTSLPRALALIGWVTVFVEEVGEAMRSLEDYDLLVDGLGAVLGKVCLCPLDNFSAISCLAEGTNGVSHDDFVTAVLLFVASVPKSSTRVSPLGDTVRASQRIGL